MDSEWILKKFWKVQSIESVPCKMSFGGVGGRTRMGATVYLNVYDLSPANDYLYPVGFGLHHSGVEILGKEYTFASGAGVFDHTPRQAPGVKFRERFELGVFEGSSGDVASVVSDLRSQFGPDAYNLITKNCNSFANAFVWALIRKPIPSHVNRLADIGSFCSCLFPQKLLEGAPVGDTNSGGNNSGFQMSGGHGRISSMTPGKTQMARSAFSGVGNTLGSNSSSTEKQSIFGRSRSGSNGRTADDLTDRREKARMAALARLEQQQKAM